MNKVSISDFIDRIGDGIHGTPCYSKSGSYYFINGNNLKDGHIVIDSSTLKIDQDEYEKIKRPLNENTILISINGTIGNLAFYNGEKIALGKSACYLNVKPTENKHYIRYILSTQEFKKYALQVAHGSTIKNLAPGQIADYTFWAPDSVSRINISNVLKILDNKITNNSNICSELESMAKTLYDYWFVQFDFPDENGKPYRTSGGEMVWNEQLKREIPKGWEAKSINSMVHSQRGVTYDKHDLIPNPNDGILVLRGNNIQNNRLVYDDNTAYIPADLINKEQKIRAHDILITMSSGSKEHIGKCVIIHYDLPHTYGAFLSKFTPEKGKCYFVYISMISDFFKKKIQAICSGTGINNLTNETFDNVLFPIPNEKNIIQFEKMVTPLFEKMGRCEKENEELTNLRDWLLPMLMNGQARVE